MAPLRIGLAGLGTVGRGVMELLRSKASWLAHQAGRPLRLSRVASRSPKPELDLGGAAFSTDLASLHTEDVDLVVELIGGEDRALKLVRQALARGQSVVTANKAIIARHGDELFRTAARQGLGLGFEAAVAGGIPVVAALARGLAANRVSAIAGILNGTSNHVLTAMAEQGCSFEDALANAQALGYAEADPSFDIEGLDAAHKLAILGALAFDTGFAMEGLFTESIAGITTEDMGYAKELGYCIKPLSIARRTGQGIEARVHPALVPEGSLLASVQGVMNAVLIEGDLTGPTLYQGAGAGASPTASAVVSDLIALAQGDALRIRADRGARNMLDLSDSQSASYLRIPARDLAGAFAKLATVLGNHAISIEGAVQRERAIRRDDPDIGPWVPIVILTDRVRERDIQAALAEVQAMPEVAGPITRIRVEHFD